MKTNNLREIKSLVNVPVYSCKPRQHNPYIRTYSDEEIINDMIVRLYVRTIVYNRAMLNQTFTTVYGRPVRFSDSISDLVYKIKQFIAKTGKTVEQVAGEIRSYLGYHCSFFRRQGGKLIPITQDRLIQAYDLVNRKASVIAVENALYL